ncbi:MAG: metalloprotease TldD, partial [Nevskiales bacterium]
MSENVLQQAEQTLLAPTALSQDQIQRVLEGLLVPGVDAADLYFQYRRREHWSLEDSLVRDAGFGIEQGVGVRVVSGEKTGFAYSEELALPALTQASRSAGAIVRQGQSGRVQAWQSTHGRALYPAIDPVPSMAEADKVALLHRADTIARSLDPRVTQVMVSLAGAQDVVLIAASDGTWATDVRPLVRMSMQVIVEENGKREQGHSGGGGRGDYGFFLEQNRVEEYAREAVRQALVRLNADPAPAGSMTVVLAAGWSGVLLHEAVGHGLEGDFNRKGSSAYSGQVGQKVASELCTIVDDGTLPGRRGSLNLDDEGISSQCTTLIEKGVLRGYMQDRLNARLMGVPPTGNGRRESFAFLPMPRMTNTYMLPGQDLPEDIIASVDKGLYVANLDGGQVDITSGNFVFST